MKDISLTPDHEKENKKAKSESLPKKSAKKILFSEKEQMDPELSKDNPKEKKVKVETISSQPEAMLKSDSSGLSSTEDVSKEKIENTSKINPMTELFTDFDAGRKSMKRGMFCRLLPLQAPGSVVQTTPPKGGTYLNQNISPISKEVLLKEINKRKLTIVERGEDGKFYSPKGSEYVLSTSVGIISFFLKGGDTVKFVTLAKKSKGASWQSKTSETISFASCNLQLPHKAEEKTQGKEENTEFKLKPFPAPKKLTKQGLSKVKTNGARSQSEFFNGVSANIAAQRCGLNPAVSYEYLHIYAHQFLGEESQCRNNLVLGTAIVNAQMIAVENAVKKIVNEGYNVTLDAYAVIDGSKEVYKEFNYATKIKYEIGLEVEGKAKNIIFYFFPDSDIPTTLDIAELIMVCFNAAIQHPGAGLHCVSPDRKSIASLLTTPSLTTFAGTMKPDPLEVTDPVAIPPAAPPLETSTEPIVSNSP